MRHGHAFLSQDAAYLSFYKLFNTGLDIQSLPVHLCPLVLQLRNSFAKGHGTGYCPVYAMHFAGQSGVFPNFGDCVLFGQSLIE